MAERVAAQISAKARHMLCQFIFLLITLGKRIAPHPPFLPGIYIISGEAIEIQHFAIDIIGKENYMDGFCANNELRTTNDFFELRHSFHNPAFSFWSVAPVSLEPTIRQVREETFRDVNQSRTSIKSATLRLFGYKNQVF